VKAVIIYADESGTHDPSGKKSGSKHPTIAGFAAPPSEWSTFCVRWQAVLRSYNAPYFHFREWAAASAAIRFNKAETPELTNNPYFGWNLKKLDKFLYTLADIAGRGNKVPIAGTIRTELFHKVKSELESNNPDNIEMGDDPFKFSMGEFFQKYHRETWVHWGEFKAPVTFFFDQSNNQKWLAAMREVYNAFAAKDTRICGISFVDKKQIPHLPLQAADMLAYRMRQNAESLDNNTYDIKKIDEILLQRLYKSVIHANPPLGQLLKLNKQ
jgi:hypothetical protein